MKEIEINLTELKKFDFDEIISELKEYSDEFEIIYKELILPFVKKGCCTTLGGIYAIINNLNDMNRAYKDIISLYEMTENQITDSFPNKSTDGREIPNGYILVDNMDYIPENQNLYDRLYTSPTEEYDESGNPINGLSNLHNSDTAPDDFHALLTALNYIPFALLAQGAGLTAGDLLLHFFWGNGNDYHYDATSLLLNQRVRKNFQDNVQDIATASESYIKDGETIIISNSKNNTLPGCQTFLDKDEDDEQIAHVLANANTFATINSADAGIVCKITRNGNHYTMKYNYYIIDYYDFDKDVLRELYDMNKYGEAANFMGYGKITGRVEWDAGKPINDLQFLRR